MTQNPTAVPSNPTHPLDLLNLTPLELAGRYQIRFDSKQGTLLPGVPLLEQLRSGKLERFKATLWPDSEEQCYYFGAFVDQGEIELQAGRKDDILTNYQVEATLEEHGKQAPQAEDQAPFQPCYLPLQTEDLNQFYCRYLPLDNGEGLFLFDADRGDWHRRILEVTPPEQLWSYCLDSDSSIYITPGRAFVNVLGIVIATIPRTKPEEERLLFQD